MSQGYMDAPRVKNRRLQGEKQMYGGAFPVGCKFGTQRSRVRITSRRLMGNSRKALFYGLPGCFCVRGKGIRDCGNQGAVQQNSNKSQGDGYRGGIPWGGLRVFPWVWHGDRGKYCRTGWKGIVGVDKGFQQSV
ncbi:MAG: hypothetical protein NC123_19380 [Butyrivibrio sp.]|nr:hypothetical protein [Butyrivibrio sp.]